jgi:NAD(P)H-flavin reductase
MVNQYCPIDAELEEVIEETPTIKTFVLRPKTPVVFRAGQFVQITVPGLGEAPFTPSSSPNVTDKLEVTVLRTGKLTEVMHEMKPGVTMGVRGPFGKGYPMDKLYGKEVLVVGGGVGLAPLRSLILAMLDEIGKFKKLSIRYGAKSPAELVYQNAFENWARKKGVDMAVTVDMASPGWSGKVGVVTVLLDGLGVDIPNAYAVSCGPEIMLKFVTLRLLELGFKPEHIYLSMNRKMSCGMGKCGRCNVGHLYLCKDGPDVCYAEVQEVPDLFG